MPLLRPHPEHAVRDLYARVRATRAAHNGCSPDLLPSANARYGRRNRLDCARTATGGGWKIGNGGTALIVDDHADFRGLIAAHLQNAGIRTIEASDGGQALKLAREADVVVLDVNLPEMNGYTICRELRAEYGERLPILFLSGYRTEGIDRAAGMLIGGDDYIVKPPDLDELLARVRRLIERTQGHKQAASDDHGLTPRELEVLQLLGRGKRASEIATELAISPKTVSSHVQHILSKLGVHSRAQAVARAYEYGLVA